MSYTILCIVSGLHSLVHFGLLAFQCTLAGKTNSLSRLWSLPSHGNACKQTKPRMCTKDGLFVCKAATQKGEVKEGEQDGLYSATVKEQQIYYSPLGEPDLKDLPSFAYQISQGMV